MVNTNTIKRIFGLTRSGVSVLGKRATKLVNHKKASRLMGILLILVIIFTQSLGLFVNIGGTLALNFNSPKTTIDATTINTVQSPLIGFGQSRGFSWFHAGADLTAEMGTVVKPVMAGIVKESNYYFWGYGNHVIVKSDDGYETIYGHLSRVNVLPNQKVTLQTKIGEVGSTGFPTGPHLHLEIRLNEVPINPAEIVPGIK